MKDFIEVIRNNLDINSKQPLKISVYQAFKRSIILGEIPAGERINESFLSEELNISRTPIRYALDQLLQEQLVDHIPGSGMIVRGISIKDAYEIYDIRKALETLAFKKAMQVMTEEDFNTLEDLLYQADKIYSEDRIEDLVQNFSDFNAFVYDKSQLRRLPQIINDLQAYLIYFRKLSIYSEIRNKKALDEHFLILRALRNRDDDMLELLIHEHLNSSLRFIVEEMEKLNIE